MSAGIFDLVVGTRPNLVKVAPLLRAFAAHGDAAQVRLVHTGQHYDPAMSALLMTELGVREPDVVIAGAGATHGVQTARIIEGYERHLLDRRPRAVVVVGDSNSTLAAALTAAKLGIAVAHVEAGLRSFDARMPEEINRRLTDALSAFLFASEPAGVDNLAREGCDMSRVHLVGNVMIDTLEYERSRAALEPVAGDYGYVSLHRPSNVDDPTRLQRLADVLSQVSERIDLVFPVHPRTRPRLERSGAGARLLNSRRVRLLEPAGYRENLALIAGARVVLTDSGGIQEETTQLGVPCLTLRTSTERPITVERGTNTLVGDALERVAPLVEDVLAGRYKRGSAVPLWDGHAADRIVETLLATPG